MSQITEPVTMAEAMRIATASTNHSVKTLRRIASQSICLFGRNRDREAGRIIRLGEIDRPLALVCDADRRDGCVRASAGNCGKHLRHRLVLAKRGVQVEPLAEPVP